MKEREEGKKLDTLQWKTGYISQNKLSCQFVESIRQGSVNKLRVVFDYASEINLSPIK